MAYLVPLLSLFWRNCGTESFTMGAYKKKCIFFLSVSIFCFGKQYPSSQPFCWCVQFINHCRVCSFCETLWHEYVCDCRCLDSDFYWSLWRLVLLFFSPLIFVGVERNARQNKIAIHDLKCAPMENPTGSAIWMSFFSSFPNLGWPASVLCAAFICQPDLLIIES